MYLNNFPVALQGDFHMFPNIKSFTKDTFLKKSRRKDENCFEMKFSKFSKFSKKSKKLKHNFILIKNSTNELDLKKLEKNFKKKQSFQKIITISNSKNIYAQFNNSKEIKEIINENEKLNLKERLNMCSVQKLPLDLNSTSRIVLITIYNEKVEINVYSISEIFKVFGKIKKIIIFKKKNYQVFIEFEKSEKAVEFK